MRHTRSSRTKEIVLGAVFIVLAGSVAAAEAVPPARLPKEKLFLGGGS